MKPSNRNHSQENNKERNCCHHCAGGGGREYLVYLSNEGCAVSQGIVSAYFFQNGVLKEDHFFLEPVF